MCSYKYSHHIEPVHVIPVSHLGVEKNNDDGKRHYFSSNRHVIDAAAEIVQADERLENEWWAHAVNNVVGFP